MMKIDPVPRAPAFMKGVINLRGRITPIIDLRAKFGFTEKAEHPENSIIIVEMTDNFTGFAVDKVNGVLNASPEIYETEPKLGNNVNSIFIDGIVKIGERIVFVLNVTKILENDELIILKNKF